MKKLISLGFLILCLTGCGKLYPDEGRDITKLSEIKDAPNGFYIVSGDNCTPVVRPDELTPTLFNRVFLGERVSFLISKQSLSGLPPVNSENKLIFKKSSEFNNNIFIVKLDEEGFTLGLRLTLSEDGEYELGEGSLVEESQAKEVLSKINGIGSYRLLSLGDELVSSEMLDDTGFIKSLKEDAFYEAAFFKGTIETAEVLQADTLALSMIPENLESKGELNFTGDGYAFVNTENLEPGYYLLLLPDNLGLEGGVFAVERG